MSLVPPHQARRQGQADQHGCPGDRPLKQGLIANVASQLLPPHLQKAALPAPELFNLKPRRPGISTAAPQLEHGTVNTDIAETRVL